MTGSAGSSALSSVTKIEQTKYGAAFWLTSCALRTNLPNCCSDVFSSRIDHLVGKGHTRDAFSAAGVTLGDANTVYWRPPPNHGLASLRLRNQFTTRASMAFGNSLLAWHLTLGRRERTMAADGWLPTLARVDFVGRQRQLAPSSHTTLGGPIENRPMRQLQCLVRRGTTTGQIGS